MTPKYFSSFTQAIILTLLDHRFFGGELSNVSCSCFGSMEARDILYGCESFKRSNCLNFVD